MEYIVSVVHNILTLSYDDLISKTTYFTTKLLILCVILLIGYGLKKIADKITKRLCTALKFNPVTCEIMETIFLLTIALMIGALVAIHIGFALPSLAAIEHKIAALGFSGVLLTLVLKGSIENTYAGFKLARSNKLQIGDYIIIMPNNKSWEGKIIGINMKYTILQNEEMTTYIPNAMLSGYEIGIIHAKSDRFKDKVKK